MSINRRQALTAFAVGASGFLAACTAKTTGTSTGTAVSEAPKSPVITFTPANATADAPPIGKVGVTITNGSLQNVTLTNPEGRVVAGAVNRERTAYTVTEPLGYGVVYTWGGSAVGDDGKTVQLTGNFTTIDPQVKVNGQFQLADGQVVGIAAPVILQFDSSISDKASVEKALTVTTTPPVEGSWAWLPDEVGGSRAHWRTREYYPSGTKVNVAANIYGVPFGDGAYGGDNVTLDFEIGRRQLVKADASSHRIQVLDAGGAVIMDFPCSYGEGDLDRNVTRSGIHVVTEKYDDFYMTNPAAGYANVRERFAVRISNNGEFIHANPASSDAQGNSNVTNGCINLSLTDAEQYFNTAMYGDPVEVTNTRLDLSYADGDIWDWAVSWDDWKAMSALTPQSPSSELPATAPVTPTDAPTPSGEQPVPAVPGG